jgi:hypothetical protein
LEETGQKHVVCKLTGGKWLKAVVTQLSTYLRKDKTFPRKQ